MRLITMQDPETNDIEHTLTVTMSDLTKVKLTEQDRVLISECGDSIADRLLVLEMVARKLETKEFI